MPPTMQFSQILEMIDYLSFDEQENKLLKIFLKLDKTIKMVMFFEEMLIPLLPN